MGKVIFYWDTLGKMGERNIIMGHQTGNREVMLYAKFISFYHAPSTAQLGISKLEVCHNYVSFYTAEE